MCSNSLECPILKESSSEKMYFDELLKYTYFIVYKWTIQFLLELRITRYLNNTYKYTDEHNGFGHVDHVRTNMSGNIYRYKDICFKLEQVVYE